MRIGSWPAVLAAGIILLVGCGGGADRETAQTPPASPQEVRELRVSLAGQPGPESAGLIMAQHLGYFADEGLKVLVWPPASLLAPVRYVTNEVTAFGVSHQPQVMLARERRARIVSFGSVIPQPTAAMIWLKKSKIRAIEDLKGKTIAIPGLLFQRELLEVILEEAGLTLEDVKVKAVGYELVSSLVSGKADAIFGGSGNIEGIELKSKGLDPVVTPVRSLGVPPYEELVLIARPRFASKYPQVIRDFRAAVRRGATAAIKHPGMAARLIDPSVGAGRKEVEAQLEATLPLLSRTGFMSPGKERHFADWMVERGLIS